MTAVTIGGYLVFGAKVDLIACTWVCKFCLVLGEMPRPEYRGSLRVPLLLIRPIPLGDMPDTPDSPGSPDDTLDVLGTIDTPFYLIL